MKPNVAVPTIMTQNVLKLILNDDITKAELLFKKHKKVGFIFVPAWLVKKKAT
jgi:hypothetical protein